MANIKGIQTHKMMVDNSSQTDVCFDNDGYFELTDSQVLFGRSLLGNTIDYFGFGNINIQSKT